MLQSLQLPAQMLTGLGLQKPHDLRGDLRGDWVADWVGTPLLGTLLIIFLPWRPFAQGTLNATTQHQTQQPGAPPPPGLTGFPEPAQRIPWIDHTWIDL